MRFGVGDHADLGFVVLRDAYLEIQNITFLCVEYTLCYPPLLEFC